MSSLLSGWLYQPWVSIATHDECNMPRPFLLLRSTHTYIYIYIVVNVSLLCFFVFLRRPQESSRKETLRKFMTYRCKNEKGYQKWAEIVEEVNSEKDAPINKHKNKRRT